MVPVEQAAAPNVPNPLDGLKRTADAAKSAVSSPAAQKVSCLAALHVLVLVCLMHSNMYTAPDQLWI